MVPVEKLVIHFAKVIKTVVKSSIAMAIYASTIRPAEKKTIASIN